MKHTSLLSILLLVSALVGACKRDESSPTPATPAPVVAPPTPTPAPPAPAPAVPAVPAVAPAEIAPAEIDPEPAPVTPPAAPTKTVKPAKRTPPKPPQVRCPVCAIGCPNGMLSQKAGPNGCPSCSCEDLRPALENPGF